MLILINLIIALLAGALARWLLGACRVNDPVNALVAVLVGILVFMLNLGANFV